jgi:hypothetical protein
VTAQWVSGCSASLGLECCQRSGDGVHVVGEGGYGGCYLLRGCRASG